MVKLRGYFHSGWAFFLPYLAVYLLYLGRGWPVNRLPPSASGYGNSPPALLTVYWTIHALHLILAVCSAWSWWKSAVNQESQQLYIRPRDSIFSTAFWRFAPWCCLALFLWLPGVYLEFPSDPWEHYSRVNEWSWLKVAAEHSTWQKSGYFLAYSLVGHVTPPLAQLRCFDLYYTACCMLLCWQYYRLARAVGLSPNTSLVFVLFQVVVFGNNLFGFYRYYGMSSTLFAQLGAVATIRIALDAFGDSRRQRVSFLTLGVIMGTLLLFIAFNHVQGLGIAAIELMAVAVWRLVAWKSSTLGWLALILIIFSICTVLWWPRHPSFELIARDQKWLGAWFGFNLFSPSSPAFSPALAIAGFLGVLNLVAAGVLLRSNHPAAWLSLSPLLLLSLPIFALPLTNALISNRGSIDAMVVFPRMLLAIPAGLALTAWFERLINSAWLSNLSDAARSRYTFSKKTVSFAAFFSIGILFVTLPARAPYFNRLYHAVVVPPEDLAMRHVLASPIARLPEGKVPLTADEKRISDVSAEQAGILAPPGIDYVLNSSGATLIPGARKWIMWPTVTPPSLSISTAIENLTHRAGTKIRFAPFWPIPTLFTASSPSGYISGHWLANDVALQHAGQQELFAATHDAETVRPLRPPQLWLEWIDMAGRLRTNGAGEPLISEARPDRGLLKDAEQGAIRAGDRIVFQPFLRTPDGNGRKMTLVLQGPGLNVQRDFTALPSPLGGIGYISGRFPIRLAESGEYTAELVGRTLWPEQIHIVRYRFTVGSK